MIPDFMKYFILSILQLVLHSFIEAQSLYDLYTIQEIKITFPFSNWDQKLDSLHTVDSDARLIATKLELNGIVYDSVGIRYKGNSTYNANRNKNPFNIKLDFIKSNQKYDGHNTLKLSSGFMDPSFLREVLAYKIARQYLPASLANFINVYVNNILVGLYSNVEDVDKDFLSNHFYSSNNAFFQCDRIDKQIQLPGSCPPGMVGSALKYVTPDSACYFNNYEKESETGWNELLNMMFHLNQDLANLENYLDVDRALWMLALNNFFVNLDSYSGSGHNYLVYENKLGRFNTIPWDLNEFYGAFTNAGVGGQLTVLQMQQLDPLLHLNNLERPLISKLFSIPKWKKRYLAHLFTILNDAKNANAYEHDGLVLQNQISASVSNDRNKFFTDAAFITNLYNDFTNSGGMGGAKTYPGLISFTNARISFLSNHPSLIVTKPSIEQIHSFPTEIHKNEIVYIAAKISNASLSSLFYRYGPEEIFKELMMFDDGLHQDGIAGDSIFGAAINMLNYSSLQYYLYSENANSASLMPPRAEYEFYTLQVQTDTFIKGDILLNELQASNTILKDEHGDFDDWIEIFNSTDHAISLNGLYLTDNFDNKLKWKFPDTAINANSFLIIWADEDGGDEGLHANFKLSKSGERLGLFTIDSVSLDEVEFPALNDNQSYGRCLNAWEYTRNPTFGIPNDCNITWVAESPKFEYVFCYPNPIDQRIQLVFNNAIPNLIIATDILGNIIYKSKTIDSKLFTIISDSWKPGLYNLHFIFSDIQTFQKIIKK